MLLLLNNVYKKGGLVVWIYPCLFCALSLSLSPNAVASSEQDIPSQQ